MSKPLSLAGLGVCEKLHMNAGPNPFQISQVLLDECAREPIHRPGSIQPHGVLLVFASDTLRLCQCSGNTMAWLGRPPEELAGISLEEVFPERTSAAIHRVVATLRPGEVAPLDPFSLSAGGNPDQVYGLVHGFADVVLVELLRAESESVSWRTVVEALQQFSRSLGTTESTAAYSQQVAQHVRDMTGYDRVMVYRLDPQGHGQVIAEARREDVASLLGLWYPASDIPEQARRLYLQTRMRVLGDIHDTAIPLVALNDSAPGANLDLSSCRLRSMSPVHLAYLHNMGVRATLVVSIVCERRLWGLVACHHFSPRFPDRSAILACEALAELVAVHLQVQEKAEQRLAEIQAHTLQARILESLASCNDWVTGLHQHAAALIQAIPACGLAICTSSQIQVYGTTPKAEEIRNLLDFLRQREGAEVPGAAFATEQLGNLSPRFAHWREVCGVLAVAVGRPGKNSLLWFRQERVRSVTWAGNPEEKLETSDAGTHLRPRHSFDAWKTEVRGQSDPWTGLELQIARNLAHALTELVLEALSARHQLVSLDLLRIRKALESAQDAILITNPQGEALFANAAFTALFGYDSGSLPGGLVGLVAEGEPTEELRSWENWAGGAWLGETRLIPNGCEAIPVSVRANTILDNDVCVGIFFLCVDLRPARQAEAERLRLEQHLQQVQKLESLGVLAGGIAHDFNNLLTVIIGNTSLAMEDLSPISPAEDCLRQVDKAAKRAAELCKQMLAYAGRGKLHCVPLSLNHLVEEMAHLLTSVIYKNAAVKFKLAPRSPIIEADATQIRQVILNLITNASDAIASKEQNGYITLTTGSIHADQAYFANLLTREAKDLPEGRYAFVEVSDTGCGIPAETIPRIFDPFFTTKFAGRGLGLAAVLGIVHGHKGAIKIDSVVGQGTTLKVFLPLAAQDRSHHPQRTDPALSNAGKGRVILVIEDEEPVRLLARKALERAGFEVLLAEDGRAGVAAFRTQPQRIAAVLLDLIMPHMAGPETFTELRRIRPDVRIILTSGYNEGDVTSVFAGKKPNGFIGKPYVAGDLVGAIREVLEKPSV